MNGENGLSIYYGENFNPCFFLAAKGLNTLQKTEISDKKFWDNGS